MSLKTHVDGLLKLIGWKLEQLRDAKKHTQAAIAKDAGVVLSTYAEMERGQRYYRIDALLRVFHLHGLDIMKAVEPAPRAIRRNPEHEILHDKLQKLLDADEPWPTVAQYNVEAVYLKWKAEKGRAVS